MQEPAHDSLASLSTEDTTGMSTDLMPLIGSSKRDDWETPPQLFAKLDAEFRFTLDPCATAATAKCARYYTRDLDGLSFSWSGERVFMNPPYGHEISKWTAKAFRESRNGVLVVGLIPARTETEWWHRDIIGAGAEVRFIRGRIQFYLDKVKGINAPFPSALVIWHLPPGASNRQERHNK